MKKKKGWNTTKLIATGGFAVLGFLMWVPSSIIFSVTGSPFGAIPSLFLGPLVAVMSLLIIRNFGVATIRNLMQTIINAPTPKVFPPFMIIPNSLITGLTMDIVFTLLKKKEKLASLIVGGVSSFYYGIMIYILYRLIGFSGIEKIPAISWWLTPIGLISALTICFLIGAGGGYSGYLIYQKIKNTSVIKRIQK